MGKKWKFIFFCSNAMNTNILYMCIVLCQTITNVEEKDDDDDEDDFVGR